MNTTIDPCVADATVACIVGLDADSAAPVALATGPPADEAGEPLKLVTIRASSAEFEIAVMVVGAATPTASSDSETIEVATDDGIDAIVVETGVEELVKTAVDTIDDDAVRESP